MSNTTLRLLILFICVAGTMLILQSAFDSSDHKKADHAVRTHIINGHMLGPTLEQRAPNGEWTTEITHSCRGVVRVTYDKYAFDYDLVEHRIHPGNEAGLKVLEELSASPMPSASPSPAPA